MSLSNHSCVFWQFAENGTGGWSSEGVVTQNITLGEEQFVVCVSDHLTSFTVLVDVAGVVSHTSKHFKQCSYYSVVPRINM